jgi:predicted ATPase
MARAEVSGERRFDAEIHRIAGEIEWSSSERKSPNAQRYSEQALDVARAQQARSLELRAATSLARLWGVQGRRKEAAIASLAFTEGFDTLGLKEAKALVEELAPRVARICPRDLAGLEINRSDYSLKLR